ncbi:hypothetical protein Tco_0855256, partial [Tanacetum coccineum]
AKQSKCYLAVKEVEYLGHVISGEGVATDPSKIEAIKHWPIPSTLKQQRGFLEVAFEKLNEAMMEAPCHTPPRRKHEA